MHQYPTLSESATALGFRVQGLKLAVAALAEVAAVALCRQQGRQLAGTCYTLTHPHSSRAVREFGYRTHCTGHRACVSVRELQLQGIACNLNPKPV